MNAEPFDLTGQTALVTGAAQGLGLAIARSLLEAGASVMLCDVAEAVIATAQELDDGQGRAIGQQFDVRDEPAWDAALDRMEATFGKPVDILVNNAARTIATSVWDMDIAEWDEVMGVNLTGYFIGCRAAGRRMRARKSGRIINLSSLAGQRGGLVGGAHYSASKGGILALTKCFALELAADGVSVNAIAPAAIEGPMSRSLPQDKVQALAGQIPVKRLGSDAEVGAAAVYLASPAAAFVTGATLDINGGLLMR
ncbi:SDR family NAD(P)-dependent oxidoreductase [Acuticoccus sp. MNP-M23]|uniref:SDR family NAD(P)-dependent oxidoreductase n=1 Tax=Acuticoccus sp. MNP-M23 TaxID=3072793 RepID=UPI002814F9A4|nr:SDR family NAD(P)-dependent oxidoreductase [Acuticoccus sp. MNP-M23]WMS44634.1 SDR family NAD(P)-dependent oxidoreductase [Acuticoccus sp. MNP-M23]